MEIEELRTLMATERVAREQDVDRCMGSIQDLFEERASCMNIRSMANLVDTFGYIWIHLVIY